MIKPCQLIPGKLYADRVNPSTNIVTKYNPITLITQRRVPRVNKLIGRNKILAMGFKRYSKPVTAKAAKRNVFRPLSKLRVSIIKEVALKAIRLIMISFNIFLISAKG